MKENFYIRYFTGANAFYDIPDISDIGPSSPTDLAKHFPVDIVARINEYMYLGHLPPEGRSLVTQTAQTAQTSKDPKDAEPTVDPEAARPPSP